MHSVHARLLTSLVLLLPACAANSADPSSDDDTATSAEMAITEDNPFQQLNDGNGDDITLDFVSGNRPNQNGGAMNARSKVAVTYDTSRLTQCGVAKNGAPSSAHLELGYRV